MKKNLIYLTILIAVIALVSYTSRGNSSLERSNVEALVNSQVVDIPCLASVSVCSFIIADTSGAEFNAETPGFKNVY